MSRDEGVVPEHRRTRDGAREDDVGQRGRGGAEKRVLFRCGRLIEKDEVEDDFLGAGAFEARDQGGEDRARRRPVAFKAAGAKRVERGFVEKDERGAIWWRQIASRVSCGKIEDRAIADGAHG